MKTEKINPASGKRRDMSRSRRCRDECRKNQPDSENGRFTCAIFFPPPPVYRSLLLRAAQFFACPADPEMANER